MDLESEIKVRLNEKQTNIVMDLWTENKRWLSSIKKG